MDCRDQFIKRQIGPSSGLRLFSGRSPRIAVMAGEQKSQSGSSDALGEFFGLLEIAEGFIAASRISARSMRIHKDSGSDVVELIRLENLEDVLLRSVGVVEMPALVLLLLAMTDRFGKGYAVSATRVHEVLGRLRDEYERCYYSGIVCERNGVESRSKTYLANFVDQNTTVGNLDIYQVMHAAGQIETLLGIGAKTNFKNAG